LNDNGLVLNVLPRYIIEDMPLNVSHMKPSTMMVKAYDGLSRQIVRTLEIELYVGL
jgi:hypothetical protein